MYVINCGKTKKHYVDSQWVYEHLHRCNEEQHYDAAAEGRSASLLLL